MQLTLLGYPLSHTLSPAMHLAALRSVGLTDWTYTATSVEPARLSAMVQQLRGADYAGANVTIPHKEAVIPFLDGLTPVAQAMGAVNTILKRPPPDPLAAGESLIGHNTDAAGFLADLHTHGVSITGRAVLVLGSGGAARAVVAACAGVGARLRMAALYRDQAETLRTLAPLDLYAWSPLGQLQACADVALIVNTTPLGMSPKVEASPWLGDNPFPPGAFVYDCVYNPAETLFVRQARAAGLRAATGLGMLVEQGALAFELWTGRTAPRQLMRAAAEQKLFGSA